MVQRQVLLLDDGSGHQGFDELTDDDLATAPDTPGVLTSEQFTGDGVEDTFTLSQTPASSYAIVTVNGAQVTTYSISGSDVVFDTAPDDDAEIVVSYVYGGGLVTPPTAADVAVSPSVEGATNVQAALEALEGAGFFGTGSDGALTLTQTTAAPAYATKGGAGATTTFTLIRDVYATDFTLDDVNGNFLLKTAGYRIFATGTFLIDAGVTVHNDGFAAVSNTAGVAPSSGTIGSPTSGSQGTAGTVGAGSGTTPSAMTRGIATEAIVATVHGGRGGNESGGGTGGGAGLGGSLSNAALNGNPRNLWQALGLVTPVGTQFQGGSGGSGGDSTASSTSGGGGGAGGVVGVYASTLINNGLIRAIGGNGGDASGAGAGAGGGGGGGGGAIVLFYVASGSTVGSTSVAAGSGGALQGSGAAGLSGVDGLVWLYPL